MIKALLLIVVCMAAGCAMHYDVTLTNGNRFRSTAKPELDDRGYYTIRDALGREMQINALRVRKIEAVSPGDPPSRDFD